MYPVVVKGVEKLYNVRSGSRRHAGSGDSRFTPDGHLVALRGISLSVKKGECFGIIGRNGSGKSTLLKVIAGILKPTSGSVSVEGKAMPLIDVGFGFEEELTGRENIQLYASIIGITKARLNERMQPIIESFGFPDYIDLPLKKYSDGMRIRLAFSTIGAVDPDVLLIDEAIIVGDVSFQKKCLSRIKELKKAGKTIIIVTHDLLLIRNICDRCMLLDSGRAVLTGTSAEVVSHYRREIFIEDKKAMVDLILEKDRKAASLLEERKDMILATGGHPKLKETEFARLLSIDNEIRDLRQDKLALSAELKLILSSRLDELGDDESYYENLRKNIMDSQLPQEEKDRMQRKYDGLLAGICDEEAILRDETKRILADAILQQ